MNHGRRVVALTVLLSTLVLGIPGAVAASADADELGVVTVLRQPAGGAVSVVAEVQPAPPAPLPADAAEVTVAGATVPATTAPLLDPAAPTAIVLDASDDGREALPQALSGAAAFLLRLPTTTPVTAIADTTPPKNLTSAPASPIDVLQLVAGVRSGGARSTSAALDLALKGLPHSAGGRSLLLLQTTGSAPQDAAGLSDRLHSAGVVLAVVTNTNLVAGWTPVARATGGLAVGAAPDDLATAFDAVAQTLQGRSVVTFIPPAGATSASLRVREGGGVLSAEVPLASGTPIASPETPESSQAAASSGGSGWLVVAVVVGLVLLLGFAAAVLVRRRGWPAWNLPREAERPAEVPVRHRGWPTWRLPAEDEHPVGVLGGEADATDASEDGPAEDAGDGGQPAVEVLEGEVLEREVAAADGAADGGERPDEVFHGEVLQGEVLEPEDAVAEGAGDGERPAEVGADEAAAAEGERPAEVGADEAAAAEVAAESERPAEVGMPGATAAEPAAEVAEEGERPAEVGADEADVEEGERPAAEVAEEGERPAAEVAEEGERPAAEVAEEGERPAEVDAAEAAVEEGERPAEVASGDGEGASAQEIPREQQESASPSVADNAPSGSDGELPPRVRVFDVTNPAEPVEINTGQPNDTREGSGYVGHHRKGRHRPRLRLKPRPEDEEPSDPNRRDRSA